MTQAILCSESSADGDMYFLVENELAFKLYKRITNCMYEESDSVEYWGGWHYDVDLTEAFDVYTTVPSKDELIARLISESELKVAMVDDMKKLLVDDEPYLDCDEYVAEDIWFDYI